MCRCYIQLMNCGCIRLFNPLLQHPRSSFPDPSIYRSSAAAPSSDCTSASSHSAPYAVNRDNNSLLPKDLTLAVPHFRQYLIFSSRDDNDLLSKDLTLAVPHFLQYLIFSRCSHTDSCSSAAVYQYKKSPGHSHTDSCSSTLTLILVAAPPCTSTRNLPDTLTHSLARTLTRHVVFEVTKRVPAHCSSSPQITHAPPIRTLFSATGAATIAADTRSCC